MAGDQPVTTLNQEYEAWIKANNLDLEDAMVLLLFATLTPEQRSWLEDFCIRWEAATEIEQWGEPQPITDDPAVYGLVVT